MPTGTEDPRLAIELSGITKRFAGVVANDDISFDARTGEVHALIGENGAGKSTLMSILTGLYRPDEGTIRVLGEPVQFRSPRDSIARGIGMVYQHFMLVEPFTVAENMMLGRDDQPVLLDPDAVAAEVSRLGAEFGLDVDPKARIWQLSVGEQQRVEILRLLYRGARVLILDEPTAVLTPQEANGLIQTLRDMAAKGYCVIFISHKLDEVMAVSDRVSVMRRGKLVATVESARSGRHELARLMVGRELAGHVEHPGDEGRRHLPPGRTVLEIRDLTAMGDKGVPALSEIDLEIRAGEILGIAGVAGNGQRELAEVITGLRRCVSGAIRVAGRDVANRTPADCAEAGIAHVPEDRIATGLVPQLDVAGNAILRDYAKPPLAKGSFLVSRAIAAFADRLIDQYDVKTPGRRTRVASLSGGNQQKLLIARELNGEPKVVVAVHPTRGVDVGATETIHGLLDEQRRRGAAVLLISEDLDELHALCDRIAVLYAGRVMGVVDAEHAETERIGLMMAGIAPEPVASAHA
ncbi:MAG: ABC transporter ATP-binding protein [Thermomicrobiales bacterium]|nr:ABC transporter ATP-binding protein [Thermomicrobiales bacterium]